MELIQNIDHSVATITFLIGCFHSKTKMKTGFLRRKDEQHGQNSNHEPKPTEK